MENNMDNDGKAVVEEHRTETSERRTRVFPRRLTRKNPEEIGIEERRREERRHGDRRSHKKEK